MLIRKAPADSDLAGDLGAGPVNSDRVVEALLEELLRGGTRPAASAQQALPMFDELLKPQVNAFYRECDGRPGSGGGAHAVRRRRSRSTRCGASWRRRAPPWGAGVDVARFTRDAGARAVVQGEDPIAVDLEEGRGALRETLAVGEGFRRFEPRAAGGAVPGGTPVVEGLATHVLDAALDPQADGAARRCGVIETGAMAKTDSAAAAAALPLPHSAGGWAGRGGRRGERTLAEDAACCCRVTGGRRARGSGWRRTRRRRCWAPAGGQRGADQARGLVEQVLDGLDGLGRSWTRRPSGGGGSCWRRTGGVRSAARRQRLGAQRVEAQLTGRAGRVCSAAAVMQGTGRGECSGVGSRGAPTLPPLGEGRGGDCSSPSGPGGGPSCVGVRQRGQIHQ